MHSLYVLTVYQHLLTFWGCWNNFSLSYVVNFVQEFWVLLFLLRKNSLFEKKNASVCCQCHLSQIPLQQLLISVFTFILDFSLQSFQTSKESYSADFHFLLGNFCHNLGYHLA